jgi:hypothetical protein
VDNADCRSSAVILWRSQDSPARIASVPNPTASALPTDPGFTGATRSLSPLGYLPDAPRGRHQLPRRHRTIRRSGSPVGWRAGIVGMESGRPCSLLILLVRASSHFTPAYGTIHLRPQPLNRRGGLGFSIASHRVSQTTDTDSFRRNPFLMAAE